MTTEEKKDLVSQIKNLLPILVVVVTLAGFYYTTQHRLSENEETIKQLEAKLLEVNSELKAVEKDMKKLKRQKAQ